MKKLTLLIIFAAAANYLFAQKASRQTITIKTQIYCNHCSKCESCGGRMGKEFPFIKGLTDYKFDEKAMTISITYNTKKTTPEQLKQAIAAIGFDADELKADPEALAKFDDCCLKQ